MLEWGDDERILKGLDALLTPPNDRYSEVEEKVSDWLRAGTRMVVVINPPQCTATVYRAPDDICILTAGDMLDGGDVVLGWKMPLADVF